MTITCLKNVTQRLGRGMARGLVPAAAVLALAGCETSGGFQGETVRICDQQGCFDAPRGYSSFDPSQNAPDPDPNGILPGLLEAAAADPHEAFHLGRRFMLGDGIRQNPFQGLQYIRDAAERGDVPAQATLGRIYYYGYLELGSDWNEAERWLMIAARGGHRSSQRLLTRIQEQKEELNALDAAVDRQIEQQRLIDTLNRQEYGTVDFLFASHGHSF
ncbi:MAG: sel1 repeat family protein [Pseudomonadota bacterium]